MKRQHSDSWHKTVFGTDRHTLAFGKQGMNIVGVDISPSCLKLARQNCKIPQNE